MPHDDTPQLDSDIPSSSSLRLALSGSDSDEDEGSWQRYQSREQARRAGGWNTARRAVVPLCAHPKKMDAQSLIDEDELIPFPPSSLSFMIIKSLLLLANAGAAALSVEPIQSPTETDALSKEGEFIEEYVTKQGFRDYQRGLAYISLIAIALMALGLSPTEAKPWFIAASAAGILGSLFRIWAMSALGRFFTFKIMIRSDHRLVETGPYRYLLHPAYTGLTIGIMSITLTTNYDGGVWSTFIAPYVPIPFLGEALFVSLFVFVCRIHWDRIQGEEKMMADHFGSEWSAFARKRYRMLPFVF